MASRATATTSCGRVDQHCGLAQIGGANRAQNPDLALPNSLDGALVQRDHRKVRQGVAQRYKATVGLWGPIVQGDRRSVREAAEGGPAQCLEMRSGTQCRTDILGQHADVGAFRAVDREVQGGPLGLRG